MEKDGEERRGVCGGSRPGPSLMFACRYPEGWGYWTMQMTLPLLFKHVSRVWPRPLFYQRLCWGRKGKLLVAEYTIGNNVAEDSSFIKWAEN